MASAIYRDVQAIEPLLPSTRGKELGALACDILRESGYLSGLAHPVVRRSIADSLRLTNSYYTHLIEGHHTSPAEIENAVGGALSRDPSTRDLQIENTAHIATQHDMECQLREAPDRNPLSQDFITWLHARFYRDMPASFRLTKDPQGNAREIDVGKYRTRLVTVGAHLAPAPEVVPAMLKRMESFYDSEVTGATRIIAIAAAHHRFVWAHPFDDGNGRVARLLSQALAFRAKIDAGGLWSISRGLARRRDEYRDALASADRERQGSLDGRGNLSDRALGDFCWFFLDAMLDQIRFISGCLEFDTLSDRIYKHVALSIRGKKEIEPVWFLLREALARGEFARGEAGRIIGQSERTGRTVLKRAIDAGLLTSDSEKTPVRLKFTVDVMESYFPTLFALGQEHS